MITTSAEAERKATESESARKIARVKKTYTNYLSTDFSELQFVDNTTGYSLDSYEKGSKNIAAVFNYQNGHRGQTFGGRFGRRLSGH